MTRDPLTDPQPGDRIVAPCPGDVPDVHQFTGRAGRLVLWCTNGGNEKFGTVEDWRRLARNPGAVVEVGDGA